MIALVDCNNFYVSCERLFKPSIREKPVIVLSNNDGCAISRSDEAKAAGIDMGMPFFMIRDLVALHDIQVFSSNYTLYGDISDRVMQVLRSFTHLIECYSVDEAFLSLDGFPADSLEGLGLEIKRMVFQHTGIPVTIGIAATKTLAKIANRNARRNKGSNGVYVMCNPGQVQTALAETAVGSVWGIGKQHEKFLLNYGITTALQFANARDEFIRKHMSVVGERMVTELRGVAAVRWEEQPPPKKAIATSRSFGYLLTEKEEIKEAVSNFASNVSLKLRKENSATGCLHVFLQTNPFKTEEKQYFRSVNVTLPQSTNAAPLIIAEAKKAIDRIFSPGFRYLKAGVMALDIVPVSQVQRALFEPPKQRSVETLMDTVDRANKFFTRDMVRFASQGYEKKWKLKAGFLSPRYTTNPGELLTIRI
jgi:DNA polymerase V